jgi:hypothetical protein
VSKTKAKSDITPEEWEQIVIALALKLKSPVVQGDDRESRDWRFHLRDIKLHIEHRRNDGLTNADWVEIYYALADADNGGEALAEKIGPDGRRMWTGPGVDRG